MFLENGNKTECCGCKVCSSVCKTKSISFEIDTEGFWYPQINNEKCIKCGACLKVCPNSKGNLVPLSDNQQFYAAFSNKNDVLGISTSGGVFTHISDVVLDCGGVVFGHCYDDELNVICKSAKSKEMRDLFCGAKYVQSDMGNIYHEIKDELENGKLVLVSGTPCQIDAVKNFFNNNISENLFLLEILCHGVPSPKIFLEYVAMIEKKKQKKILDFKFREKDNGWTVPMRKIIYSDNTFHSDLLNNDAFNNLFLGTDCILRPSCYYCRYAGRERVADISIGDFWGVDIELPEMFNKNRGCSLVLLNTEKGKKIFDKAKSFLTVKQTCLSVCASRNLPLVGLPIARIDRDRYFETYRNKGLEKSMRKYCFIIRRSFKFRVKRLIKLILGSKNILIVKQKIFK